MKRRVTRRRGLVKARAMFRMRTSVVVLFRDYCRDRGLPLGDTLESLIINHIVLDKTRTTYEALSRVITENVPNSGPSLARQTSGGSDSEPSAT